MGNQDRIIRHLLIALARTAQRLGVLQASIDLICAGREKWV